MEKGPTLLVKHEWNNGFTYQPWSDIVSDTLDGLASTRNLIDDNWSLDTGVSTIIKSLKIYQCAYQIRKMAHIGFHTLDCTQANTVTQRANTFTA